MTVSDLLNHLGLIWYHSEPSNVPYSPNHFLGLDFFAVSYSKTALICKMFQAVVQGLELVDHSILAWKYEFSKNKQYSKLKIFLAVLICQIKEDFGLLLLRVSVPNGIICNEHFAKYHVHIE